MRPDYTEADTDSARYAEQSSAGVQTTQLGALPPEVAALQSRAVSRRNNLGALALLAIGLLLLLGQMVPGGGTIMAGMILLTIASCFLFFAFWRRIYGLLIPGAILSGLSIGVTFASVTSGVSVLWGLSLGFLAIFLIGRSFFHVQSPWPVYPAVPLFAVGMIIAISNLPALFAGGMIWLPLMLIALGVYLGWMRRNRQSDQF